MSHRFYVNTAVEVHLGDVQTSDLRVELASREEDVVATTIATLASMHCPDVILDALKEWAREPVVDKIQLDKWLQAAGVQR